MIIIVLWNTMFIILVHSVLIFNVLKIFSVNIGKKNMGLKLNFELRLRRFNSREVTHFDKKLSI